jgi:ornithine cyclodeaminase
MHKSAIWLSEANVASLVTLNDTVAELENGLRHLGQGKAFNIPKALGSLGPQASMHSLGSSLTEAGYCGYKNWVNTPQGAKAVFILFHAIEGRLLAIMEANALGQMRTSAMTGLGTKWMAPKTASDMAMIGSGRQALAQVAAVNAVRPLKRLRVWSPTPEKRRAFCAKVSEMFTMEVIDAPTLEQAIDSAEIVTTVTRAREPFLNGDLIAKGAHYNAVGAILPSNAEFHQNVFDRAGMIAVDDVPNTRKASREFMDYFDQDGRSWDRVRPLGEVIANNEHELVNGDITLFKSMGMGISDLSVAALAYQRAQGAGIGMEIPLTQSAQIRWDK